MFLLLATYADPKVIIGSLVMYSVLVLFCIFAFIRRSSLDKTPSLYHTLIVAVFGMLSSILPLQQSDYNNNYTVSMQLSGLFFGGTLTPLIWMAGITIFLSISTGKRPLIVMAGYFFTFVQFALLVVYITFFSKILDPSNTSGLLYDGDAYGNTYISLISINWVFFLLFSALVIQHGHSVSKTMMVTLIIFGILNTGRLIIETVLSFKDSSLGLSTYLYLLFFFTDFASAISLYMSTLYWKDLTYTKPGHYP